MMENDSSGMHTHYLGHLPPDDPLNGYLRFDIAPQLGIHKTPEGFRIFRSKKLPEEA